MNIRSIPIIPLIALAAMAALLLAALPIVLIPSAAAQEPVEAAAVRGHISSGSGVWRAGDFGWFFYDMDKGQGGEQLRIDVEGRTAEKGHIIYSSQAWSRQFEYQPWGSYQAVAFLGKPYIAGYPESSFTEAISSLGKGALRRVLIDEKEVHTLTLNRTLPLLGGYALALAGISEKNDVVNFVLLKNGKPVHAAIVSTGGTYVYKVDGIPALLVHLASAMRGPDSGFAEVEGVFQVSDTPDIRLFESGRLGLLELTDLSEEGIEFRSEKALTFTSGSAIPLTADLRIVVVDDPGLHYYPEGLFLDYGVHEIRGPTFGGSPFIPVQMGAYNSSVVARWNSQNFTGYYFDPEKSLGYETLVLYGVRGRTVLPPSKPKVDNVNKTAVQDGFQYTTILQPKEFGFKPWGYYFVISFLGTQWFAGYDSSLQGQKASKSLLEHEYLGRVLTDSEVKGALQARNYTLAEGYEMRIRDVENDSIFLELLKNGAHVDSSVVKSNSTYIYKKDLGDVKDMPIIMVHINNVFNNGQQRFATIDGIFQISDQYVIPVEPRNGMNKMEIVSTQPGAIFMVNNEQVNLNRDSTVTIAPGMNIRVADNDSLRYCLFTAAYVVPRPLPPAIDYSENMTPFVASNFSMMVQAAEIRRVIADILDTGNRTVASMDITPLGRGSGEIWAYAWRWNATALRLSDDGSALLDASGGALPAMLYLHPSTPPVQVGVRFDATGRIASIADSRTHYFVSRQGYEELNTTSSYDAMLVNETERMRFMSILPGESMLRFMDVIDGKLVPGASNHTLQGSVLSLEPHAVRIAALPGRYEISAKIENAVGAKMFGGKFFQVLPLEMKGIAIGDARVAAGEKAVVSLAVPAKGGEKKMTISYDPSAVRAVGVTGNGSISWKDDSRTGRLRVVMPAGSDRANLTFQALKANATFDLKVVEVSGFLQETIENGSITVLSGRGSARKSGAAGAAVALAALAFGLLLRRRS